MSSLVLEFVRLHSRNVFVLLLSLSGWDGVLLQAESNDIFFESRVRPLLIEHCADCHGQVKQEGGLRLDRKDGFSRGGDSGELVLRDKLEESLLLKAVLRVDAELKMPPKKALAREDVAILRRWILGGATWPDESDSVASPSNEARRRAHWAYQAIPTPEFPELGEMNWAKSNLDRFVLSGLDEQHLAPSPRADRATLIRRAYLALIGLPPQSHAVREFELDKRPDAFARVVDELLSRPEYGEQWGRHWLDVARYSDAKGYVDAGETKYPFAYTYRDYVIRAFNEDLPYDQFVREQLAADRLPGRSNDSLAALGFLTVGARYNFFPHEIIDDRIDVVTRGFLGLSVACARCHDHKYDPITAENYYSLYGIFAESVEPTLEKVPVLSFSQSEEDEALKQALEETAEKYHRHRQELHERVMFELRAWCGDYLRYVVQTTPEHRTESQPELQTKRGLIREVSAYARGGVWRWREYLETRSEGDPVFGLWRRLGRLDRDEFASRSRAVLHEFSLLDSANPLLVSGFQGKSLNSMADVADVYASLLEGIDGEWRKALGIDARLTRFADSEKEELRLALYHDDAPGSIALEEAFDYCTLDESVELRKHYAEVERVFLKQWNDSQPRPMILEDSQRTLAQHVFLRGDSKRLGPKVPRAIPTSLGGEKSLTWEKGSGRLELARTIASDANPLTARVIVNRLWAWHFGRGLVRSLSDFGVRSDPPSHPELLDYLAFRLIESGWSIKSLQREILLSATWQQVSDDRQISREKDAENRWLWRQNRRRLRFEEMRDSMLQVSGELEMRSGGVPIQQAPDSLENKARTIYSFVDRERLAEIYRIFDFPSPDITASERSTTTVPQQSLFLLNSPFVIARAEALAKRVLLESGGDLSTLPDLVRGLFQRVYARSPEREELDEFVHFLSARPASDKELEMGAAHPLVSAAQTLILSNEFLFVN